MHLSSFLLLILENCMKATENAIMKSYFPFIVLKFYELGKLGENFRTTFFRMMMATLIKTQL